MKRITLDNGTWFDQDRAQSWSERQEHDGRNMISCATETQWDHERLYRTAKGTWVLNAWSDWQGTRETYSIIEPKDAALWLVRNRHDLPEELLPTAEASEV